MFFKLYVSSCMFQMVCFKQTFNVKKKYNFSIKEWLSWYLKSWIYILNHLFPKSPNFNTKILIFTRVEIKDVFWEFKFVPSAMGLCGEDWSFKTSPAEWTLFVPKLWSAVEPCIEAFEEFVSLIYLKNKLIS